MKTLFIEPSSPWENGDVESFNGKLRDELLNGEILSTLKEAKVLIETWREHDNTIRPHSSLGCRPPAPEAIASGSALRCTPGGPAAECGSPRTLMDSGMETGGRS